VATDVMISLPDGGDLNAVMAIPQGPGPHPVVIAIHEAFDIDASMRSHVDRMAGAGYLCVMPNLFSRGGARKCLIATFRALMKGEGTAFDDIAHATAWAKNRRDTTDSVGVIGFCMGGGFALLLASRGYDVASANYARLPAHPESALEGACPIVASYGATDASLRGVAQVLDALLDSQGIVHDVKEYSDTGHAFLNPYPSLPAWMRGPLKRVMGVTSNPDAAPDAWARIDHFFAQHLHPPSDNPGAGDRDTLSL